MNAEAGVGCCLAGHLSISLNITLTPATILVNFSAEFTFKTSRELGNSFLEENTVKHDSTGDSMVSNNQG